MTKQFASANGQVFDRKIALYDPESGRVVQRDKRGGRTRRAGGAPLDPIIARALAASMANRPAAPEWDEECPF